MRGRPGLYTSYEAEAALLPTRTKQVMLALLLVVLVLMPFSMPVIDQIPFVRFLGDAPWLRVVNRALILAIAALGLVVDHARSIAGIGHDVVDVV